MAADIAVSMRSSEISNTNVYIYFMICSESMAPRIDHNDIVIVFAVFSFPDGVFVQLIR